MTEEKQIIALKKIIKAYEIFLPDWFQQRWHRGLLITKILEVFKLKIENLY